MPLKKDGQKKGNEKKKIEKTGKQIKRGIQKRGVKAPAVPKLEVEFIPDPNFDDEDFPDD